MELSNEQKYMYNTVMIVEDSERNRFIYTYCISLNRNRQTAQCLLYNHSN